MMGLEQNSYPSVLLGKLRRRLLVYYHRWFCQQNYVFRHVGPYLQVFRKDCSFACYRSFCEVPENVKADISGGDSIRLEMDKRELDDNAFLWAAFAGNKVVSTVFTRKGKYFKRWFIDLQPNDLVFFRLSTHPEYRGRGLAPSLISHVLYQEKNDLGVGYIDSRIYNKPSIRCIKKAGFECIAKKKTISREWALDD